MEKILKKANKKYVEKINDTLREVKNEIDAEADGKGIGEDDKTKSEMFFDKLREELKLTVEEQTVGWDFSKEKKEEVFDECELLALKSLTGEFYAEYIETRKHYSIFGKKFFENETTRKFVIEEITDKNAFILAVIRKSDSKYLGYVGIKDTSKSIWEFCVEFLPEFCGQGYGAKSLKMFLKKIAEITQHKQFRALVEVDNMASQALMKKLGGKLTGIYDFVFHSGKWAEEFEEENLDNITDHMRELAEELNVEPRKLLSHVLDYRIFVDKL